MNILITVSLSIIICYISCYITKNKSEASNKFMDRNYTTTLKGISIFMIMLCHMSCFWTGGRLLSPLGGTGVAIFLIISGYGLTESYKRQGLANFWQKRLLKVYFPYAIVCILLYIFKHHCIYNLLTDLCLYTCPFWFVQFIIIQYIVFYFCFRFGGKYKIPFLLITSFITLIITDNLRGEQSLSFLVGILASLYYSKIIHWIINKKYRCLLLGIALFFLGILFLALKQIPEVRTSYEPLFTIVQLFIKLPLGLSIILLLYYFKPILHNPFIHLLGIISYELYLVHFPFWHCANTALLPSLLVIFLSMPVSYLFNKCNMWVFKKL